MKKFIILFVFLAFIATSRAQISLEKIYNASAGLTELAIAGCKYYLMDVVNNQCGLYNESGTELLSIPGCSYLEVKSTTPVEGKWTDNWFRQDHA